MSPRHAGSGRSHRLHDVADPRLASLRAERESDLLRERRRRAQQRRERIVGTSHRVEVLLHAVAGVRLDDHPRAVGAQRQADVARGPDRVAHVMQAIEHRHEVVVAVTVRRRRLDLEANPVGEPRFRRSAARGLDQRAPDCARCAVGESSSSSSSITLP